MSAFKRYQSKVFWGQMESRDHGGPAFYEFPEVVQQESREGMQEPEELMSISAEEHLDSIQESDATDPENTTVIHIELHAATSHIESHPEHEAAVAMEALAERSFSPASRGQRSQDSGFSDSGRSDSSAECGAAALHSPRRRRRRRSSRRRSQPRLQACLVEGPAHTSTPKQDSRHVANRLQKQEAELLSRQLDFSLDGPAAAAVEEEINVSHNTEETLGDFLYASEPPEEEQSFAEISRQPQQQQQQRYQRTESLDVRAPVKAWLEEISWDVEDECMATLQSKSLPRRKYVDEEPESRDLRLLTASATTAAKKIIDAADRFDKRYQQVVDSIGNSKNRKSERDSLHKIEREASEILAKLGSSPPRRIMHQENQRNVAIQLGRLKNNVDRAFDDRLDFYIEKVVRGLEEAPREGGSAARGALAALTALGLAGPRAGASVARCSGIRALLTSLVSSSRLTSQLRSASLRALGSVCCCLEPVDQFVAEGGPEILTDVLVAESTPQAEKSEAAALLVQITAPWMDRVGLPYVEPYADQLIKALTELAEQTGCKQTLLLAAAAINHLSRSRKCIGPIIKCDSIKKLLRCVKKSSGGNVWLMEQVASLVGQVARVPQARAHLGETRASVALVCFLRMQPPGLEDEYRRLEATASEALTRLCVYPEIAKQVVAVGGSNCLPTSQCSGQACNEAAADQMFHSTKSLRLARKIAGEQIDIARIWDCSPR